MAVDASARRSERDRDRGRKRRRGRSRSRSRSRSDSADAKKKRSHRHRTRSKSRSRSATRGRKRSRSASSSRSSGSPRSRDRGGSSSHHRKRKASKKSRREKDRKSSRSHRRRHGSRSPDAKASRSRSAPRGSRRDERSSHRRSRSRSPKLRTSKHRSPSEEREKKEAKKEADHGLKSEAASAASKSEATSAPVKEAAAPKSTASEPTATVIAAPAATQPPATLTAPDVPVSGNKDAKAAEIPSPSKKQAESPAKDKAPPAASSVPSTNTSTAKNDRKRDRSRSRSRSRSRDRRRTASRRSRSRSRGRDRPSTTASAGSNPPPAAPTPAPKAVVPTTERAKTFKFSSIALKGDARARNGGLKKTAKAANALTAQPFGDKPGDNDEKKRRREKMKLWREQQAKQKEEEAAKFLAPVDAVPKQLPLLTPEHLAKKETDEEKQQRERIQQVVQEVDPLDAYMAGLVDEAAIHNSLANPASNVISLDEIESKHKIDIYGTFLPAADAQPTKKVEKALAPKHEQSQSAKQETPKEREAREERELKEFMKALKQQREKESGQATEATGATANGASAATEDGAGGVKKVGTGRIYQGFEEDIIGEDAAEVDQRSALEILQDAQRKKEIKAVDHSQMNYIPFQKKFYVVPKEIKDMTEEEVEAVRKEFEIKIRGKSCPRPLQKWTQCGFSVRMLQLIQKHGYSEPFAIQRQALPAIMSGRDVIGIAKTGSGKTLAFLLPMFRHILHQPPLQEGEGPIGLILAPARELAQQIYLEAKRFAKGLGMRATAVYGGSSVSEQIANLKRGSDVVICTPGRMIDILCMSAGKMVSLQRVTYVVLDEADRMFDMGFEPQITKIMLNIRPDRQTLLFSATFPRAVESLARKVLKKPVEITVGARSTASGDITQYVEVREESDKFMRLLQLLGLWYEKGNVLVFVSTQQACDKLFQDLMKAGYPALSLHGGKDQVDRDYTIDDFKRKVRTLMVATSVAGRGLDVKDLVLVINYHCPNHLEDYVHRVGRTGRAGRKGTAYTFISPDEEEYAVDLVKALESAKQVVPPELVALADGFKEKVKRGEARYHGSGFKGKGFTFDETERNETQRVADLQKRQYEIDQGIFVEQNGGAGDEDEDGEEPSRDVATADGAPQSNPAAPASSTAPPAMDSVAMSAFIKAQKIIQNLDLMYKGGKDGAADEDDHFTDELEINDYPQQARWKVTQKEASESVSELTGAAIIARGSFVPAGRKPNPGERKLYLAIEASTRAAVLDAKRELQRILDETTLQVGLGGDKYGKYNL